MLPTRLALACLLIASLAAADRARLVEAGPIDEQVLCVRVEEGVVTFRDDATGATAYGTTAHDPAYNSVVRFGTLAVAQSTSTATWTVSSSNDPAYATPRTVTAVHRKTKLNGLAQLGWDSAANDYSYDHTLEHLLYLRLPTALVQGRTYTLTIGSGANIDAASASFTYDIFATRSAAVHINLNGYDTVDTVKAADLHVWMGDGGARDYSAFVGRKVYLYAVGSGAIHEVGAVAAWKPDGPDVFGRNMIRSPVWTADFTGFLTPGTWRLAIEGVGCSPDFTIRPRAFREPFLVSTRGFFYMRIGQDSPSMAPVPRRPLYRPGIDPVGCRVVKTTMHPWHPAWAGSGDRWDQPSFFAGYVQSGSPQNPDAWGGHSDALDWDRHLGHISIIHDLLLPYLLSGGAIGDDDLGIAESGNGIPDVIDEARNEVDFWLRLRDGAGYAHGLSNPDGSIMYQAAATPLAAWAAAANAAMLADAFRVAGRTAETISYRDAAVSAYTYANGLADPWLDVSQDCGMTAFRGRDLKMTAAAHLFNITGSPSYEAVIAAESVATTTTAVLAQDGSHNQLYATAAYLITPQAVGQPALRSRMLASLEYRAQVGEANRSGTRPSRRGTDENHGYFHTIQNMHHSIIAHATSGDTALRATLLRAMTLEADWGLGRNPLNRILMTTASTPMAGHPSIQGMYTSGRNDGTPGLHPGHTPYLNMDDWGSMVMAKPSWMAAKGYPAQSTWPGGELQFDARYVWAHGEFTPQQTMRGKQALYGYLYAVGRAADATNRPPTITAVTVTPATLAIP